MLIDKGINTPGVYHLPKPGYEVSQLTLYKRLYYNNTASQKIQSPCTGLSFS